MQQYVKLWLRNHWQLVIVLAFTILVYAPSLNGEFVIDDIPFIRDNPYIRDISHVTRFFTKGVWENSAHEINNEPLYRPMNLVPAMLNHALWGDKPLGYHVFLLLLHLANTCMVYALIRKIAAVSVLAASVAAGLFALHPAKVESVAWISGGIDPLVTFFVLGAMLAHRSFLDRLDYAPERSSSKAWWYWGLSLVCFQLALWSKEVAFVFPLVVVTHDWIYRRRIHWPTLLSQAAMIGVYLVMRSHVLEKSGQLSAVDWSQFSRVVDFALGYSEMLVLPAHIPFYLQPPEHSVSSVLGIASILSMVLLAGYSWHAFEQRRKRDMVFAVAWSVGFFWPAILLAFYTYGFYAGRYLYVASVGVALFAALLLDFLVTAYPARKKAVMVASAAVIACYSLVTWKDVPSWHDAQAIYGKVAAIAPENAVGFIGLGYHYLEHGDNAAAEKNFQLALQKANTLALREECLVVLGTISGMNNRLEQSESYMQQALKVNPKNSEALSGLGNLEWMRGRAEEAIVYYEQALVARPDNYEAAMNLASAYEKIGQFQRADSIRQQAAAMNH